MRIYSHPIVAARRAAVEALRAVKIGQFEGGYGTNHVTKLLPVMAEGSQAIEKINRGERIRTSDLLVPNQARYQATPRPEMSNGEVLSDRRKPRPGQTTSATYYQAPEN